MKRGEEKLFQPQAKYCTNRRRRRSSSKVGILVVEVLLIVVVPRIKSSSNVSSSRYSAPKISTTNTCYLMIANDQAL